MSPRLLGLWFFPKHETVLPITFQEKEWSKTLGRKRAIQYVLARGKVRLTLSSLFGIPPLDVPLIAPPGEPPKLAEGFGHISISHCKDALIIGWSKTRIGIDIERADRSFNPKKLIKRYFQKHEKEELLKLDCEKMRDKTLDLWIIKEAAIKFQEGSIALDLGQWEYIPNSSIAINKTSNYKVSIRKIDFKEWKIAVAYDSGTYNQNPIICNEMFQG